MTDTQWIVWTVVLFVFFVAILGYIFWSRSRRQWQEDARIPFEDEQPKRDASDKPL